MFNRRTRSTIFALLLALLMIGAPILTGFRQAPLYVQDDPAPPAEGEETPPTEDEADANADAPMEEGDGAPTYEDIITADAITQEGVFKGNRSPPP